MPPARCPADQPRTLHRSGGFLLVLGLALVAFAATFADAALRSQTEAPRIAARAELVGTLGLTDLSLFTEARYTRHPSQADLHSAFQDHPLALEHFPSGSLVPPMVPGAPR